ncbi:MAG: DMT family transporter [Chloroflexi bacterium]|nr:DMT family transporter [Chloroflexota bacterium]
MEGSLLALLAANSWAISYIFTRLGLEAGMKPVQGTMLSLLSSFAVVAVLAVLVDMRALLAVPPGVVLWFALVGILNFPLGRLFNFLSVGYLGAARAAPILAASPLFAIILAMVFMGERPTPTILAGALAILAGISLIVSERAA